MTTTHNASFAKTDPGIPPLAGLATYEEAARVGFSVDENVDREHPSDDPPNQIALPIRPLTGATI